MSTFRCPEKDTPQIYSYRNEIEAQIITALAKPLLNDRITRIAIRTAARLLRMNMLESSLLTWLLGEGGCDWGGLDVSSIDCGGFAEQGERGLFLVLLLNGYYVKTSLSDCFDPALEKDLLTAVPAFKSLYHSWRPCASLTALSLSQVNALFSTCPQPLSQAKRDYNQMVAKILQLSKTYNIGGNDKPPKSKKKGRCQEEPEEEEEGESMGMESANQLVNLSGKFPDFQPFDLQEEYNWGEEEDKSVYLLRSSSRKQRSGEMAGLLGDSRAHESRILCESELWRRGKQGLRNEQSIFDDM